VNDQEHSQEQQQYLDDRMFVLGVWPVRLAKDAEENHQTVIFYDVVPPQPSLWGMATYHNVEGYPIAGINHFDHEDRARAYKAGIEPSIPLTSLGGQSPNSPMNPDDFAAWKAENNLGDFDPDKAPRLSGKDRGDIVVQTKEQFIAGLEQVGRVVAGPKPEGDTQA
jgi:hypothetical protein